MHSEKGKSKLTKFATLAFIIIFTLASLEAVRRLDASPGPISTTVETDSETYLLRQKVMIQGDILLDDVPVTNMVVSVQINNPLGYPEAFRTLQIGTPTQTWPINITGLSLTDTGNNPINTAKTGLTVIAGISLQNWQLTSRSVYGGITVFDGNVVPIGMHFFAADLDPGQTTTSRFSFEIPKWACSGKALIIGTVYSKEPKTGGLALSPEETMYYCISKTQQGLFDYPSLPPPPPQNTPGTYLTSITLPPDPRGGTYNIYVVGQASPTATSSASTTFNVQDTAGYPPQASFVYLPTTVYLNMTATFDSSFSTAEGHNDKITKYEWDFGDGTPKVVKTGDPPSSTVTHAYQLSGTFEVTLNATDNEGLWCTTSKLITILPEFNPTANFTWAPLTPFDTDTVTFNSSNSTPGWCANTQSFSPIQNFTWNFDDGTVNTTTSTTITHIFGIEGNYTVTLTVKDACGRAGFTSNIITVLNTTTGWQIYDVNGDGKIDLIDVFRVALAYGSYPGHPRWDPACDFNNDGIVDLKDYFPVVKNYGKGAF